MLAVEFMVAATLYVPGPVHASQRARATAHGSAPARPGDSNPGHAPMLAMETELVSDGTRVTTKVSFVVRTELP